MDESHELLIDLINTKFLSLHESIDVGNNLLLKEIEIIQKKQDKTNGNVQAHSLEIEFIKTDISTIDMRIDKTQDNLILLAVKRNWPRAIIITLISFYILDSLTRHLDLIALFSLIKHAL